ncbi:MAG: ribose 5-phosphate isomerase B [Rickettsiales bacterium]|jgi:ribose 5-phosphate isomerase B|nr:ribose 5-phosphate isomerase B [Rickettsiales bacterium]
MTKILIACDGAGIDLKKFLMERLGDSYNFENFGADGKEPADYPDYARLVAEAILNKEGDFGILICGTGIGMSIAANRFKGIRAGLCHNILEARLTREHNNANILCLGARMIGAELALEITKTFLGAKFEGGRHLRRVEKIDAGRYE